MVLLGCRFDRHYVEAANILLTASQTAGGIIFGGRVAQRFVDRTSVTPVSEAGVRTVAHGFEPWVRVERVFLGARLSGRKKAFFRPLKRAHEIHKSLVPPSERGGYGSYAGFADEESGGNETLALRGVTPSAP